MDVVELEITRVLPVILPFESLVVVMTEPSSVLVTLVFTSVFTSPSAREGGVKGLSQEVSSRAVRTNCAARCKGVLRIIGVLGYFMFVYLYLRCIMDSAYKIGFKLYRSNIHQLVHSVKIEYGVGVEPCHVYPLGLIILSSNRELPPPSPLIRLYSFHVPGSHRSA